MVNLEFTVSLGPELTERQAVQRDETERAADILRAAGISCRVTYLVAGSAFPKADSAMITIEVQP